MKIELKQETEAVFKPFEVTIKFEDINDINDWIDGLASWNVVTYEGINDSGYSYPINLISQAIKFRNDN